MMQAVGWQKGVLMGYGRGKFANTRAQLVWAEGKKVQTHITKELLACVYQGKGG